MSGPTKGKYCDPEELNEPSSASFKIHQMLSAEEEAKFNYIVAEIVDFKDEKKCWTRGKIKSMEKKGKIAVIVIESDGNKVTLE